MRKEHCYVQYHNVGDRGLPLTLPPFAETQLCIVTGRANVQQARGQVFLIAGLGTPRRYFLWETFNLKQTEPIAGGRFRASGTGWQLAPPQELVGAEFEAFRTACANFVGFRRIDHLPFCDTLRRLSASHRPPGDTGQSISFLRDVKSTTRDRRVHRLLQKALAHYEPTRALSVRQPHAEAIMRSVKTIEYRSAPTKIRERIFIYASLGRYGADEEADWMREYGIADVSCDVLPRGVIVGTVELYDCRDGEWYVRSPKRADVPMKPDRHPQPVWFFPF